MPPHQAWPKLSPPATQHPMGDVEGIHETRALQQRQGKPVSVEWVDPFSGAGTQKVTFAFIVLMRQHNNRTDTMIIGIGAAHS